MNVDQVGTFLEHQGFTDDQIDTFLEHFGAKGMKWGVRKQNRLQNKMKNNASRQKDRIKNDKAIDAARDKMRGEGGKRSTSKGKQDWKDAKAKFKKDKVTIGSREARKVLNKSRDKINKDYYKSQEAKTGRETTVALAAAGVFTVAYVALLRAG